MQVSTEMIESARQACVDRVAALKEELLRLRGQIDAYDSLLKPVRSNIEGKESCWTAGASPSSGGSKRKGSRKSKPPGTWEAIMRFIGTGTKTVQELCDFSVQQGVDVSPANLRSQMTNYRKVGFISRDGAPGEYSLTMEGRAKFGVEPERLSVVNGAGVQRTAH